MQRGLVSGFLGVCVPIASVSGTFLVQLFTGNGIRLGAVARHLLLVKGFKPSPIITETTADTTSPAPREFAI